MTGLRAAVDVVAYVLLLLGSSLCLTAGLGLLRFPDVLSRMHAATKPQVMGVLLILVGAALRLVDSAVVWMLLLVGLFQLLTAPLSAHLVSRIAYRRRHVRLDLLLVDEVQFVDFGTDHGEDAPHGDEPAEAVAGQRRERAGSSPAGPGDDDVTGPGEDVDPAPGRSG